MDSGNQVPSQNRDAADKNASFFGDNPKYAGRVARLTTYRNQTALINRELAGIERLIDIGNGGVFEYDTRLIGMITAVDLFPESTAPLPPNVVFREGDALKLPFANGTFDGALMAMVFHHLTGDTATDLVVNVRRSIAEAHRVLEPGGKFIVMESCVPRWFYQLEQPLFRPLAGLSRTRLMRHPPALQLPSDLLVGLVEEVFGSLLRFERVPIGTVILQFGHRWPTFLTPARPHLLTAQR